MKILIVSDIHANWPALQAVLSGERHIDAVMCLGDIVNYGPHPAPCLQWVRQLGCPHWVVQGNHDRAVGLDEDPRCSEPFRPLAAAMQRYTAGQLDEEQKSYLAELPLQVKCTVEDTRFTLCHAVPSDPLHAYVDPDDIERWEDEVVFAGHPEFLLVGHTHRGFIRQVRNTIIINPGSVGQPKDGDPKAAYAVLDDGEFSLRSANYDIDTVAHDLSACAPPEIARQLTEVLRSGGHFKPTRSH